MSGDKKCCGFDPNPGRATLLGVFTLAYPLFIVFFLSVPLLMPFGRGENCPACRAAAAGRAMLKLINAAMFAGFRTRAAGSIYAFSPAAAGLFFKYFNFALITAAWALLAALAMNLYDLRP